MELWWPLALLRCLFTKGIDPSSIAGNAPESHPTPGVSDGGLGTGVSSISCAIFSCSAAFFDAATAAFSALCSHWPGLIGRSRGVRVAVSLHIAGSGRDGNDSGSAIPSEHCWTESL